MTTMATLRISQQDLINQLVTNTEKVRAHREARRKFATDVMERRADAARAAAAQSVTEPERNA